MKAIILRESGKPDNFYISDFPEPSIGVRDVLVKVKAISINPADAKMRSGDYRKLDFSAPVIMGWDMSGTVVKTGQEVTDFKIGDNVFGMLKFPDLGNTYAEYVSAPTDQLALVPENVTFEQAAASTLAALTAYQAIILKSGIKPNDKVLVHAASGGVGHFAVQLAKSLGAYVIGTSSLANKDFVLELGADEHVDYKGADLENNVSEVDFVLDSLGTENILRSIPLIKKGGKLLTILHGINEEVLQLANERKIDVSFHLVSTNSNDIKTVAELLDKEVIKPHIAKIYPFKKMADAHSQIETGRTIGKIIITV